MSTQEKITQLALAALRSAPPVRIPKPATFMTPFEKPKALALVSVGEGTRDARFNKSFREQADTDCFNNSWPFARQEVWI